MLKKCLTEIAQKKVDGDGSYIATIISILMMVVVLVFCVNLYGEIVIRNDVERIHRKYLLSMERTGYLTSSDEGMLRAELSAIGVTNIDLTGTSMAPVGYGGQVRLVIKGQLMVNETRAVGKNFGTGGGARIVNIDKTGTALY